MAATLNAPDALPRLTEVIGSQLGAEACLILKYHRVTKSLFYTFCKTGDSAQFWMLMANSVSPQIELQCRAARSLIQHEEAKPPADGDRLPWREGLQTLLQEVALPAGWLDDIQTCSTISVTSAPDMEGAVLLLHQSVHPPQNLSKPQEIELAGLLAIAFHQHHLQHQAQRSSEQLTYLNYLKEDFLSTLNHELRTPLTSMMLAIRMLRRPDLTPERAAMYLDILEQQCSREINLVNDLLMLQKVDARPSTTAMTSVDLGQLLTDLAHREQSLFARAQLQLKLDLPSQPITMATSGDHLTRVLQELLTNARKYANPGSTITLSLHDESTACQAIKLYLTNTGAGIHPEELPHIFNKFHRGQNATKNAIPGTGTGLALVKGLLKQLNGHVSVTSQPMTQTLWQTCFTVELPLVNGEQNVYETLP